MIALVKITQVIGQFKRFGRGPGVLMRGELDDDQRQIPVHGFIHEFPIGLISSSNEVVAEQVVVRSDGPLLVTLPQRRLDQVLQAVVHEG